MITITQGAVAPPQIAPAPITTKRPALFTKDSAKTKKGEKLGYTTLILYMQPWKANAAGKNLCPNATAGCIASCLYTAGRGKFNAIQLARQNRTNYFLEDRAGFIQQIAAEIAKESAKVGNDKLVVRMNGTTDIPWENVRAGDHANLMDRFPMIQFYDYTKSFSRLIGSRPDNYHLTFSRAETASNIAEAEMALNMGYNVAAVFSGDLPETYMGFPVVDGDQHDLTFLHPAGAIIGLRAKGDAKKDQTGFVIRNY